MQSSIIPGFLSKLNIARQGHMISIKVEFCKITLRLLDMFEELGIIRGYKILYDENKIKVFLKYTSGSVGIFFKLSLVSSSSKRVYVDLMHLVKLKENKGSTIFIISTPYGILFDSECLMLKVGGEVLIKVVL